MSKDEQFRLRILEHLVKTKLAPNEIRRSDKIISSLGFFLTLVLFVGPVLYFQEIGPAKFVFLLCGALSGIAVTSLQYNVMGNRQLQILHDFIDFESVQAELGSYDA